MQGLGAEGTFPTRDCESTGPALRRESTILRFENRLNVLQNSGSQEPDLTVSNKTKM